MTAHDSGESRRRKIEIAAYHMAERRNFAPGHEHADWVAAEALIERESAAAGAVLKAAEPAAAKAAKVVKAPRLAKPPKVAQPVEGAAPTAAPKVAKARGKRPPATP